MRAASLLRSLALGLLLGYAGWRGTEFLLQEGRPGRLLERAAEVAPGDPPTGLTAVLLFGPDECPSLAAVLDHLGQASGDMRVVGALMVEEYRMPDWKLLIKAQRITFPVYRLDPARARASTHALGYRGGPVLLVFDRAGRLVLATDDLEYRGFRSFLDSFTQRFAQRLDPPRTRT